MKRLIAAAAVAVALASLPARADVGMILGHGAPEGGCGEWTRSRDLKEVVYESWVLGYVTGVPGINNFTRSMPNNAVLLWAKNYCRAHPFAPVSDAAAALIQELARPR
jgi:hypothetical protein